MTRKKKATLTGIVATLVCLLLVPAARAQQNSGHIFFCQNDQRNWTLYQSTVPRMLQQEIAIKGPGTFTLDLTANRGFGFEGFAYTRSSAWDKWKYVNKTAKGQRSWRHTWRVPGDDTRLFLLQLIKDNDSCPNCTISMHMRTSQCQANQPQSRPSRQPCPRNYCLSTQGLYGITGAQCVSKPGWNGGNCP